MTELSSRRFATLGFIAQILLAGLLAAPCVAQTKENAVNAADQKRFEELSKAPWQEVFADPCTKDWKEKWTLDGLKAKVSNGPKGMDFSAGPVAKEDASHAVLWTKQSFKGDVRIEYEFTRPNDDVDQSAIMLYIQASGIGEGKYDKDITTWADLRAVPTMTLYHSGMHLYHISIAAFDPKHDSPTDNYIRARWYGKGLDDSELPPDYMHTGLFAKGVPHHITVIKKGDDLFMRVAGPDKQLLCHWNTSAKPPVTEGPIGLRHMWTRAACYRDFRVSVLKNEDATATTTKPAAATKPVASTSPATAPTELSAAPNTFLLEGKTLLQLRARKAFGHAEIEPLLQMLLRKADVEMKSPLRAVTDKPFAAPSGDKHDYVYLSPYFWPDPSKPDGLPYIQHDGVYNPEVDKYDRTRMNAMSEAVYVLSLAYYLTGDESYGRRAAQQLRTWFLDDATKMNPHLKYTSMIKGTNEGSFWGVLNTEILRKVVDAEPLLVGTSFWSADDHAALQKWFVAYLDWLYNGEMGKKENKMTNNHGTLYDMQTADFALFTGDRKLAKEILEGSKTKRIATQIEPDGSMPLEMARTRSLSYSLLNLVAMAQVARLGEHVGVDLWNYKTADGRGIRAAIDWMLPYATGQKPWPNKQITKITYGEFVFVLRMAAKAYNEPAYEQAISHLATKEDDAILWTNLVCPEPR